MDTLDEDIQYSPLKDQWELEVRNIWAIVAARLQANIAVLAAGAGILDPSFDSSVVPFSSPEEQAICNACKMRVPPGFSNINVFGLGMIVAVCGVITLINITLTPFLKIIARYRDLPRIRRWIQDGMLHVQRKAYEGVGVDGWDHSSQDVPPILTNPGKQTVSLATAISSIEYEDQNRARALVQPGIQVKPEAPGGAGQTDSSGSSAQPVDTAEATQSPLQAEEANSDASEHQGNSTNEVTAGALGHGSADTHISTLTETSTASS